jgi:hypothetical protein
MKAIHSTYFFYGFTMVFILFVLFYTSQNAFFWDTVQLGSLQATFYYDSNFSHFLLPDRIDSGHIPAFGMYIAFMWKLFGRTLLVSHLAMLPFILCLFWQTHRLVSYFFKGNIRGIAFLLILLDTCLLGQLTLISPDVVLIGLFLMAFNAILRNQKLLLSIAVILLFLTSMRGMMVSFCFLFPDVFLNISFKGQFSKTIKKLAIRSVIYIPALAVFILFSYLHYSLKGWIGYHQGSPWAGSFQPVDFVGFFRNLVIYAWRLLDFGRIIPVVLFFVLGFYSFKNYLKDTKAKTLIIVSLIFLLIFPINMLWASGLLLHRYLLPISILISLTSLYFLMKSSFTKRLKLTLITLWCGIMLSGNFWIYPDKIAQGWDATLAHLPYYEMQKEAVAYFDSNNIDLEKVETFFPSHGTIDAFQLNNDFRVIEGYEGKREYVIYSNINNITDEEYDLLHSSEFRMIKSIESNGIFLKIFKKNID